MKKPRQAKRPPRDEAHKERQERYERQKENERDYTLRRIPTPNLDSFNGVAGGWC